MPNYWKIYPTGEYSDAAIAEELLTILDDICGYKGVPTLKFKTEKDKG